MTVNEMIYKTLNTKETKTPKYKEVLEALGYELVTNYNWSYYDYWGIKMKEDNKILNISQGYDKKKRLYKTHTPIKTKDMKKVDFVNLLNTDRSATRWYNLRPKETKIEAYRRIKSDIRTSASICEDYKRGIEITKAKLCKDQDSLKYWETKVAHSQEELDKITAGIKK